jgi:hypothetical protein
MAAIITKWGTDKGPGDRPLWNRLLWFVALWGFGVLTITVVGYAIRYFVFS